VAGKVNILVTFRPWQLYTSKQGMQLPPETFGTPSKWIPLRIFTYGDFTTF